MSAIRMQPLRRGLMFVLSSPSGRGQVDARAIGWRAERLRRERVTGLAGFVDGLLKEADESAGRPAQRESR